MVKKDLRKEKNELQYFITYTTILYTLLHTFDIFLSLCSFFIFQSKSFVFNDFLFGFFKLFFVLCCFFGWHLRDLFEKRLRSEKNVVSEKQNGVTEDCI